MHLPNRKFCAREIDYIVHTENIYAYCTSMQSFQNLNFSVYLQFLCKTGRHSASNGLKQWKIEDTKIKRAYWIEGCIGLMRVTFLA